MQIINRGVQLKHADVPIFILYLIPVPTLGKLCLIFLLLKLLFYKELKDSLTNEKLLFQYENDPQLTKTASLQTFVLNQTRKIGLQRRIRNAHHCI